MSKKITVIAIEDEKIHLGLLCDLFKDDPSQKITIKILDPSFVFSGRFEINGTSGVPAVIDTFEKHDGQNYWTIDKKDLSELICIPHSYLHGKFDLVASTETSSCTITIDIVPAADMPEYIGSALMPFIYYHSVQPDEKKLPFNFTIFRNTNNILYRIELDLRWLPDDFRMSAGKKIGHNWVIDVDDIYDDYSLDPMDVRLSFDSKTNDISTIVRFIVKDTSDRSVFTESVIYLGGSQKSLFRSAFGYNSDYLPIFDPNQFLLKDHSVLAFKPQCITEIELECLKEGIPRFKSSLENNKKRVKKFSSSNSISILNSCKEIYDSLLNAEIKKFEFILKNELISAIEKSKDANEFNDKMLGIAKQRDQFDLACSEHIDYYMPILEFFDYIGVIPINIAKKLGLK